MKEDIIYLIIDLGTTSVKISGINEDFDILYSKGIEYGLIMEDGYVEVHPDTYWDAIKTGIRLVVANLSGDKIAGITITSQGETIIPVDEEGNYLYPAVVWLDNRAEKQAQEVKALVSDEEFFQNTGIPECNGMCPISKLLWFQEKQKEIYDAAKYFFLLEDYIIYKLTGSCATEKSLLSTTGYFNIHTDSIWNEILEKTGLDAGKIPDVYDCGTDMGNLLSHVAEELGISQEIRVITGAMDQVCGAIGAGNIAAGTVTETTGTALCIGETIHKTFIDSTYQMPVYRHFSQELYLLLPVCMTAGMALKWFKDNFCKEEELEAKENGSSVYDILNDAVIRSKPLAKGMLFLPYLSGSLQPYHMPDLRGGFFNVGLHHVKDDFVRSIMEGVGYMLKENLMLLEAVGGEKIHKVTSMGGGAKSPVWCKIKADINNILIEVEEQEEVTSIGAAYLCALGLRHNNTIEEIVSSRRKKVKIYTPHKEMVPLYEEGFERYKKYLEFCSLI